ncbi:unnamed protein product, partial [Oppiella nova]
MDEIKEEVMIVAEKEVSRPTRPPHGRHMKTNANANEVKSNVQILNEMFPNGTSYVELGRTGPPHDPIFRIGVHVNGMTFEGTSRTKQRARHEAARHAIQYFSQTVPLLPEPTLLA